MRMLWIVLGITVGAICLALSLLMFTCGNPTQTILEFGSFKFNTNSLGIAVLLFAFVAFGAPFLYHQGVAEGSENSIPPEPSAAIEPPSATVTATATATASPPIEPESPAESSPSSTTPDSPTSTDNKPNPSANSPTAPSTEKASSANLGPWKAKRNGIQLVVEKCSHRLSKRALFGCQIRLENTSQDYAYMNGDEPIIFVDNRNESYGIDSRETTFPVSEWSSIEGQDTKRGIVILDTNPPKGIRTIQVRMSLSKNTTNFVLSADIPYTEIR